MGVESTNGREAEVFLVCSNGPGRAVGCDCEVARGSLAPKDAGGLVNTSDLASRPTLQHLNNRQAASIISGGGSKNPNDDDRGTIWLQCLLPSSSSCCTRHASFNMHRPALLTLPLPEAATKALAFSPVVMQPRRVQAHPLGAPLFICPIYRNLPALIMPNAMLHRVLSDVAVLFNSNTVSQLCL